MRHVLTPAPEGAHAAPRRRFRILAASAVAVAVAVVPAATGRATPPLPGLRLIIPMHHLDVQRYGTGQPDLFLQAPVYVAPTHGGFEIDPVRRHGVISLWLVRRTATGVTRLRQITTLSKVHMPEGIPGFFTMRLRNSDGKLVAHTTQAFCPTADFGGARVNRYGPPNPTFPYFCGSPLTRATVWGLDAGWAVPVYADLLASSTAAPDGNYTLTIRIDRSYVSQLHLDPTVAVATLNLTVTTNTGGGCPPKIICHAAARPSVVRRLAADGSVSSNGSRLAEPTSPGGLPDLSSLPARGLRVEHNSDNGKDYLDFNATIWNRGPGQMDVEGFRRAGRPTMVATQFIYRNGLPVRSQVIGTFEFDTRPGHNHWHLEDFAQYALLTPDGNRVVRSQKQSFCLAPTDPVNLTLPGALWQPDRIGLYSSCPTDQSIWLRETLPAGWGDTYVQSVAGQSFNLTGIANGDYLVRVTSNPYHRILEKSYRNNVSLLRIQLGGTPGARTVKTMGAVTN